MDEENKLLTDFLDTITGSLDSFNQKHLNIVLPFWNTENITSSVQKNNVITECIITAEKKGVHFHQNNHGFVAILRFPQHNPKSRYRLLETFYKRLPERKAYGGMNALQYLINELIDNIYQHSQFSKAYLGVERYDDMFMLCICDDGITIKQSLQKIQPTIADGSEAIKKALQGVSSKNEQRGWGLSSTVSIARHGYHAEILIVSSDGACWIKDDEQNLFNLDDASYHGTLLEFRMKLPIPTVDIYEYL